MTKNFLGLLKKINLQNQGAPDFAGQINKVLKAPGRKLVIYSKITIRLMADLNAKILEQYFQSVEKILLSA